MSLDPVASPAPARLRRWASRFSPLQPQSAPAPTADVRWVDLARVVLVIGAIGLAGAGLRLPAVVSLLAAWIGPRLLRGRN